MINKKQQVFHCFPLKIQKSFLNASGRKRAMPTGVNILKSNSPGQAPDAKNRTCKVTYNLAYFQIYWRELFWGRQKHPHEKNQIYTIIIYFTLILIFPTFDFAFKLP
jgi:hypothetical protein